MSGADNPVPILFDESLFALPERTSKPLLYLFVFRLKVLVLYVIYLVLYSHLCLYVV